MFFVSLSTFAVIRITRICLVLDFSKNLNLKAATAWHVEACDHAKHAFRSPAQGVVRA